LDRFGQPPQDADIFEQLFSISSSFRIDHTPLERLSFSDSFLGGEVMTHAGAGPAQADPAPGIFS
jgi:hypothetical protein